MLSHSALSPLSLCVVLGLDAGSVQAKHSVTELAVASPLILFLKIFSIRNGYEGFVDERDWKETHSSHFDGIVLIILMQDTVSSLELSPRS